MFLGCRGFRFRVEGRVHNDVCSMSAGFMRV